ncbi:hypothetical protein GCM10023317_65270 [Actinopolymorpha pittospori]
MLQDLLTSKNVLHGRKECRPNRSRSLAWDDTFDRIRIDDRQLNKPPQSEPILIGKDASHLR